MNNKHEHQKKTQIMGGRVRLLNIGLNIEQRGRWGVSIVSMGCVCVSRSFLMHHRGLPVAFLACIPPPPPPPGPCVGPGPGVSPGPCVNPGPCVGPGPCDWSYDVDGAPPIAPLSSYPLVGRVCWP